MLRLGSHTCASRTKYQCVSMLRLTTSDPRESSDQAVAIHVYRPTDDTSLAREGSVPRRLLTLFFQ